MKFLQESLEKHSESPDRFPLKLVLADLILAQNDQEKFSTAESYLQTVGDAFQNNMGPNENIDFSPAYYSKSLAALKIYNEDFEGAYQILNGPSPDIFNTNSLKKALQIKYASMPQKLKEVFRKDLETVFHSTINSPSHKRFFCEYEEAIRSLVKNNSHDKELVKKKLKAIQEEYPHLLKVKGEKNSKKDKGEPTFGGRLLLDLSQFIENLKTEDPEVDK